MHRAIVALVTLALPACAGTGKSPGTLDKVFDRLSIDGWPSNESHIRWDVRVSRPLLDHYLRLRTRVRIRIDGAEIFKRQGQGNLLFLAQFRDSSGALYQNHQSFSLDQIDRGAYSNFVVCRFDVFVTPGDYQVSAGLLISSTGEHAVVHSHIHVSPLAGDPLHGAWRDIPPVEFLASEDPPEDWYLPLIIGRLNLPVATERPIHVELLINQSPTEQVKGARRGTFTRSNMAVLIPAMKVLSQVKWKNGSFNVSMLDLERRRVSFRQDGVAELDWTALHDALNRIDPFQIDTTSLQNREQDAQFFLSQIRSRLAQAEESKAFYVLIVLSGPMKFAKGEDLSPLESTEHPHSRIFYIRCYSLKESTPFGLGPSKTALSSRSLSGPSGARELLWVQAPPPLMSDSLVRLVQPAGPRLFDVTTPLEFRKALAVILREFSRY